VRPEPSLSGRAPTALTWLEIEAPSDAEPVALYADLRAAGWSDDYPSSPAYQAYDDHTFKPLGYTVIDRFLLQAWLRHVQKVERRRSAGLHCPRRAPSCASTAFERVPVWHKTLATCSRGRRQTDSLFL